MPALPETNRIDNSEITSIVMADPNNVNLGTVSQVQRQDRPD